MNPMTATEVADVPRPVLSLDGAAAYLAISRRTLSRLIAAGRIRALQVSEGRKVVERRELDAYLASLKRAA